MTKKNTLYEILDIPATTACQDVPAAHRRKLDELQADKAHLSPEEYVFRLKLLDLARDTLSDPLQRREYDDKLMSRAGAGKAGSPQNAMAVSTDPDTLNRRADALSLRADALALRADAMSIKTDVSLYRTESPSLAFPTPPRASGGLKTGLRAIVITIGTLGAIWMLTQVGFVYFAVRKTESAAAAAAKAEEQIVIQEYYQKYGVRPASAAEARLLEAENQRKENEEREAEYARQRAEEETRRFQEDARRMGERVSSELRYAEEMARREDAQKQAEKEAEERRREWAERERIEREKDKWRAVLSR